MARQTRNVKLSISVNSAGVTSGASVVKNAMRGMSGASQRAAQAIGLSVVNMLGFKLGHAMDGAVAALQRGMREFKSVEGQALQLSAILGKEAGSVDRIKSNFQDLAVTLPLATGELMNMGVELTRTGALQKEHFDEGMIGASNSAIENMVHFSRLAGSSMSETGSIMGTLALQISDNMDETVDSMGRLTTAMMKISTITPANSRFLLRGAQRVLATGKAYEIAAEDVLLFLGAAKASGQMALTAGNNMSLVIEALHAPKSAGMLAKVMGLTTYELKEMRKQDPSGTFIKIMDSLRGLAKGGTKTGTEMTTFFKKLGLGGRRALALARSLTSSAVSFKKLRTQMKGATNTQEALVKSMTNSLAGLEATLKGTIDVLLSQFAEAASIFIKPIIRGLNSIIGSIQEVAKSTPMLTGLVVVIGGLLVVVLGAAGALLTLAAMVGFAFLGIENLMIMMAASTAAAGASTTATAANTAATAASTAATGASTAATGAAAISYGTYTAAVGASTAVTGASAISHHTYTAATGASTAATAASGVATASNMGILLAYVRSLRSRYLPSISKAIRRVMLYTGVLQTNTATLGTNAAAISANAGAMATTGVVAGSTTTMVGGFFGRMISGVKKLGGWFIKAGGFLVRFLNLLRLFGGPVLLAIIIIVGVLKGLFSALKEAWNSEAGVFLREGFRSFAEGIYAVISPIFMIFKILIKLVSVIVEMIFKIGIMKLIFLALGGVFHVVGFLLKVVGAIIWGVAVAIEYIVNMIIDLMNVILEFSAGVWNALVPKSMETEVSVISKSESVPSWEEFTGSEDETKKTSKEKTSEPGKKGSSPTSEPGEKEMAAGGIATGPTHALIGESGPEAVLPLSYLGSLISSAMKSSGSPGSNSSVGDTVVPVTVNLDGERLGMMEERIRARDLRRAMNHGNLGLKGIG